MLPSIIARMTVPVTQQGVLLRSDPSKPSKQRAVVKFVDKVAEGLRATEGLCC